MKTASGLKQKAVSVVYRNGEMPTLQIISEEFVVDFELRERQLLLLAMEALAVKQQMERKRGDNDFGSDAGPSGR